MESNNPNETVSVSKFNMPLLRFLEKSGVQFEAKGHSWYKFRSPPFQDLTVEHWFEGKVLVVSVCHYGEQNGDAMKDPEVVIRVDPETKIGIPVDFYQDFAGHYSSIYERKEDGDKYINKEKLESLQSFCETWAENLKFQGHKIEEREVELL